MIIGVMSDLHDNVVGWGLINKQLHDRGITVLFNCGDTCAPAMVRQMSEDFSGTIHTIFGNVADRDLETEKVKELKNIVHYGDRGDVQLDGKRIGFTHKPDAADRLAKSGDFDLVCHGHTHLKRWEKIGECYILNPGTAGGMFQYPSFATVDLTVMKHEFIEVKL